MPQKKQFEDQKDTIQPHVGATGDIRPGMGLHEHRGRDAEIERLGAENLVLRNQAQRLLLQLEEAEEERDQAIADLEIIRDNYARRCR